MAVDGDPSAPPRDQLRLMTVASRLYHERGVRQRDIATQLGVSQPRVSRLLQQAEEQGIVRTVVVAPEGIYPEPEEALEDAYKLRECHVVEVFGGDEAIPRELGVAAARYLGETTLWGPRVGFTSWSSTLREMARELGSVRRPGVTHVVEMLGDLGAPLLQHEAGRATLQLARALGAEPVLLRTPGVLATAALREAVLRDAHVGRALRMLDELDLAFVGVGPADFHGPLREGDNFFSAEQLAAVRGRGRRRPARPAVHRRPTASRSTPLDDLVVAITHGPAARGRTRVVVAGGTSKWAPAARGAARRMGRRAGHRPRQRPLPDLARRLSRRDTMDTATGNAAGDAAADAAHPLLRRARVARWSSAATSPAPCTPASARRPRSSAPAWRWASTTTCPATTAATATRSARASPLGPLMAELVGKADGVCGGKGGSLHLADFNVGSLGESGIVGSSIPIAIGAGLSSQGARQRPGGAGVLRRRRRQPGQPLRVD